MDNRHIITRLICLMLLLSAAVYLPAGDYSFSPEKVKKLEKMLDTVRGAERTKVLNDLSKAYWWYQENPEKILEYGQQALESARKFADIHQEAAALANIGFAYVRRNNFTKAMEFTSKSLEIAERWNNKKNILFALTVMGELYDRLPDYKKSMQIYQRMKSLFEELNDKKGIADSLNSIAGCYYKTGKTNIAMSYYKDALNTYKEAGETERTVYMMLHIGMIYAQTGYTEKALENFLEAVTTSENKKMEFQTAVAYNQMGKLYSGISDYSKALDYYEKSLSLYRKLDDTAGIIALQINIGSTYKTLKQYDKALDYFYKALELRTAINPARKYEKAEILLNIGHVFFEQKNLSRAMEIYEKALELGLKFKDLYIEADCLHYIGRAELTRGNLKKALNYLEKSLTIAEKINKAVLVKDNYKLLSDIYVRFGKTKKALDYFKLYSSLKDRILNEMSAGKIAEIQTRFEMEKKEKEMEILKRDNQIQKLLLNRQRMIRNGLIIFFILIAIIAAQFLKKYRYLLAFWKKKNYIGHYKVVDKLASGGMGIVYKAYDIVDKTSTYAVKILREEYFADEIQKKRFKNEAFIIDQFNHPNIVKVIERGEAEGNLYLVMELLEGRTLTELIEDEERLSIQTVLNIMTQTVDALATIHSKNIIHRDMKPENIMIIETQENPYFIKLLDFGLAKTKTFTRLTKTGLILGSVYYLSPEQILETGVSTASDIYSVGIICSEMLTGRKPFEGSSEDNIINRILNKDPLPPSVSRPDIPETLNLLVMAMIDKDPNLRPPAETVLETIKEISRTI